MALLDLGAVTNVYTNLLTQRLKVLDVGLTVPNELNVSGAAPDAVSAKFGLGFYLYHLREDAHTKAQDWQSDDDTPLRYKPMGVTLYYVLCPRSSLADAGQRALAEQRVMGLAVKTLHDFPVLDDNTEMLTQGGLQKVLPLALRGRHNRFRVLMQPTSATEAGQYWSSGSQAMRLAAYYEVSATLIEPEVWNRRAQRVLSVGVHSFVRGQPLIESVSNTISFTPPGFGQARELELSPAEAAYGQTLEIRGADLQGDKTFLLLTHTDFAEPVQLDSSAASWNVSGTNTLLKATVRADSGAAGIPAAQPVLPGIYGVLVKTVARRTLPDGSVRDFDNYSNPSAFAVAPKVLNVTHSGGGLFVLRVEGFTPHTLAGDAVQLFAGVERLARVNAAPAAGQCFTPAPPPPANSGTLQFRLPAGTAAGSVVALRLIVRGVEAAPLWVVAP